MSNEYVKKTNSYFPINKNANHTEIYDELIKEAKKYFNTEEILLIKKAYLVAKDLHRGQKRNSGEPYIIHPTYVAYILLESMKLHDADSIAAALLHDTIEDCGITKEWIANLFNQDVANLVMGVTKMKELVSKKEKEDYNNYLLLKSILKDYREIYIKLADRLHNMRTLEYKEEPKRIAKSAETLRFFVPLATHVEALKTREELVDISFRYLSDRNYREIKGMSDDYLIKHQPRIEKILKDLEELEAKLGITANIRPRIMNHFAIYQSLIQNKKISLLPNLISFDIMVEDKEEINKLAQEISQNVTVLKITDFIANPRPNGYQALHLQIKGKKSPFQIRLFTKEMFLVNNYGFAALIDIYPKKSIREIQEELIHNNPFFQSLNKNYKLYKKPFELINTTVRELLAEKINVHVADGTIYCLPAMSTVADLAYKIHSKLKSEASSAKVNGIKVDLNFPLKENDYVVIITKEEELKKEEGLSLTRQKKKSFQ